MKTNILTLVITLVVGIVLTGALLAPVLSDSQEALYEKETNTGTILLNPVEEAHTGSIALVDGVATFTIDGNALTQTIDTTKRHAAAIGNNFMIGATGNNIAIDYWDGTNAGHVTTGVESASFEIAADKTVTLKYTVSGNETTINVPENDWIFVANDNGTYIESAEYYGGSAYVTDLNQFYSGSWTFVSGYQYGMHNTEVTVNGVTIDPEDVVIDTEAVGGFTKVNYSFTDAKTYFTFDANGTDKSVNVFVVIVPKTVQYMPESNQPINSIYGAILPIVIVSLVMVAIGAVVRSRDN